MTPGMEQQQNTGEARVCCICGATVEPPYNVIGQRAYCDRHYALVNKPHAGFWRAGVVQLVGVAIYCGVVAGLAGVVGKLDQDLLVAVGILLAVIPSALWLFYFYRQDRLESEPKAKIAEVFVLAMLLTAAVGLPLVNDWFQVSRWAAANNLTSLLASTLIAGFTWQAITYFAVRWVVYATPEFDERMDGIVYGTIAGLGVATALNLQYVLANGGVALAPGVVQIATTALAQASFGGVVGYFMAEAKFAHKPVWWVPAGVTVAAVLNGLFRWLSSEVSADGLGVVSWRSLVLGLVVALAVFFVLLMLMRRVNQETLSEPAGTA